MQWHIEAKAYIKQKYINKGGQIPAFSNQSDTSMVLLIFSIFFDTNIVTSLSKTFL